MSKLGKRWEFDGIPAAFVTRSAVNGHYCITFEREEASLEQIEQINWDKPSIRRLTDREGELGLPEGYGFELTDIRYQHSSRYFVAEVRTARQYLGDVTGYQDEIKALNNAATEKDALIRDQNRKIIDLQDQLAEADELAIALYEAQTAAEDAPAESDAEEVTGE